MAAKSEGRAALVGLSIVACDDDGFPTGKFDGGDNTNVTALKDATHDVERAARLAKDTPLTILSGDDALTLPLMNVGAKGVISVAANVVPAQMARLCAGQDAALGEGLAPLFSALFVESNPIPLKFALAESGRIRNELRLPLVPLASAHENTVREALRAAEAL